MNGNVVHTVVRGISKLANIFKVLLKNVFSSGNYIRNISIHTRLLSSFFILSFIPLLIIGLFSYHMSSSAIKSKISTYSVQIMNQIRKNIQREINKFVNDSIEIQFTDLVQDALKRYNQMSPWEKHDLEKSLNSMIIKKFSSLYDVSDVVIYTNKMEKIKAYGDEALKLNIKQKYLTAILNTAQERNGRPAWMPTNPEYEIHYPNSIYDIEERKGILLCRSIRDINTGKQIGYILMRMHEKYFLSIYQDIDIGQDSRIFIVDSNGMVVSSNYTGIKIGEAYQHKDILSEFDYYEQENKGVFYKNIDNRDFMVAFTHIEDADWYVVGLIPYTYLTAEARRVGSYTVVISMACLILAISFSFIISRSISAPLKRLIYSMNEMKEGNLSISIEDESNDEISKVTNNFNIMSKEIKMLLTNVETKERQKKIAELKALQAQINPHFLSNTLNSVRWLAHLQNAENIEKLTTSLIYLLHGSMGKGEEFITVEEEVNYLKNYINIQEYRYYDKFKVLFNIDKEILNCRIPRFILQPIVENSIIHGIEPMNKQGLIVIKAFEQDGDMKITITDNGVGVAEEKLDNTLSDNANSRRSRFNGIGLENVEERIKLFYGQNYGIFIQSIPGLYTTVEVTLPISRKEGSTDHAKGINC